MVLLNPVSIRFSAKQQAWLQEEAQRQEHDRVAVVVRGLVDKAMVASAKKGKR